MTEDEAKTKWCPFAIEASFNRVGINRNLEGDPITPCIGSSCMAWRWIDGEPSITGKPKSMCEGYCGLAVKL